MDPASRPERHAQAPTTARVIAHSVDRRGEPGVAPAPIPGSNGMGSPIGSPAGWRDSLTSRFAVVGLALVVCGAAVSAAPALACTTCGCTLSSDWASQGFTAGPGLRVDFRYDYFAQRVLRSGTGTVDRGGIPLPSEREIQQETLNGDYTLSLDYSRSAAWGIGLQIPYADRFHTTIAPGDTAISTSHTESLGDVRVTGRYQRFGARGSTGVQFGVKLPTGAFHEAFSAGPQSGGPVDRGLQPGTGTTDLLAGVYRFGAIGSEWEYFAQALIRRPLDSREGFRPSSALDLNVGARYASLRTVTPHLQLNVRAEDRESGSSADAANSGATLVYLSPGLTVRAGRSVELYGFVQLPVLQRVNGYQVEPRSSVSLGLHFSR